MNINYDTLPDLAGADGFAIDILAGTLNHES